DIHNKFQDLEWQQRNRLVQATSPTNTERPSQWARVTGEEVLKRNRYMNVDPFLNNRIMLKVPEGHDPYINASPITLTSTKTGQPRNFIATQGPKETTHAHIWRMLWHECASPATIIMLTQTHESGREKCYPYFPRSLASPTLVVNATDEFSDAETLTITLLNITEDAESRSTVRELEVVNSRCEGERRTVWHLLFEAWPDFGVPEEEDHRALLRLIPLSRENNSTTNDDGNPKPNPRIIHCSAGVGRSGTFIALDHLLLELEEGSLDTVPEGRDPVAETVERLREQRMMMVQGEAQFGLLYDTLRERWGERW
ncbi:receptor/non-receptor type protein-tyrosine phosphatase, partial [Saccharata proteae CBS 121410]